jgi:hypothetical protein
LSYSLKLLLSLCLALVNLFKDAIKTIQIGPHEHMHHL